MLIYSRKYPPPGFYVYAYLRENGTPYYIGKGKDDRAWKSHQTIPLPKDKSKIIIMEKSLSEIGAFALERFYIRWYGRKDLQNGILRNRTDGGEGSTNIVPWNKGKCRTEEEKRNISKGLKGKTSWSKGVSMREETKNKLRGRKRTKETVEKIREARKKQIICHSEETKKKIGFSHIGKKHSNITKEKMRKPKIHKVNCTHCGLLCYIGNAKRWHFDNCKNKDKIL